MFKNIASQKIAILAFDTTTSLPKTGDGANITPYVSKDYGTVTVLGTTTATEMDATNAPGWYSFTLAQAETNGDALLFSAKSSTANIRLVGQLVWTTPPNFNLESIDSNGRLDLIKIAGTTQTARDLGASVLLSAGTGTGQLDITSGVTKANAVQINGVATAAARLALSTQGIVFGTVGSASTTTAVITSTIDPALGAVSQLVGRAIVFLQGTTTANLRCQAATITASAVSIAGACSLTVTALTDAPVSGDTFVIV